MRSRRLLCSLCPAAIAGLIGYAALIAGTPSTASRAAEKPATPAVVAPSARPGGTLTFSKDVAPILMNNCASCHRLGEVAPFPLLSYEDAKKRARQIALVTERRLMPPWKADSHGEFQDERRLTEEQIGVLRRWAEAGAPEGKAADLPPAPKFTEGWQLGEPDVVIEPDAPYALAAEGEDVYRCFVVPTKYAEDRYIAALEVRPDNRRVVHHLIAFLDTSGAARQLDAKDAGPGYTAFGGVGFAPSGALGGWAPGNLPRRLPEGVGILLPKGADIVLQVHYHKSGKPETDRTRMGLYFAKGPVEKRVRVLPVVGLPLRIPPGAADHVVQGRMPILANITVLSVMPHMHLIGREMTVTATLPDGAEKRLVHVPDWDFNWQTTYAFKEPLKLPAGSRIGLSARYDNSEKNPRNPNQPPRLVTWGEQTNDEMCIAFVSYTADAERLTQGVTAPGLLPEFGARNGSRPLQQLIRQFDKNGDGRLDEEERRAAAAALGIGRIPQGEGRAP
jgi:hypothetical protein